MSQGRNAAGASLILFARPGPHGARVSAVARLEGVEGQSVLRRLLESHPELRGEAEEIARTLIGEVSFETMADDLAWELESRTLEDLELRSARLGLGAATLADAAWEHLQEAVDPLVDDMRRRLDLGLADEARDTCRGIIVGLYRARGRGAAGCLGRAPDFPEGAAETVLQIWRQESPRRPSARAFAPDFVARHAPEWKALLARASRIV